MDAIDDRARVRELLGREPAGAFEVVVRSGEGDPIVIRNAAFLDDGTPMPTRYWLVGPAEVKAVSRLEARGGVKQAEAAVDPDELEAAHARYAAERDASTTRDVGPQPSGGVGGTRRGVKCLHAHYAWHLAGGVDPVGRWVARALDVSADHAVSITITITETAITVELPDGDARPLATPPSVLTAEIADTDPPSAASLTNVLGMVTDDVHDLLREQALDDVDSIRLAGDEAWHLACVERGDDRLTPPVVIDRDDLEDLFRALATEPRRDRLSNPALRAERVDSVVATCCVVLAVMRRMHLDEVHITP